MIDPVEVYENLKNKLAEHVGKAISVSDQKEIKVNKLWWDDSIDFDDLASQKEAKLKGKTWGIPLYGDISLVDPKTGKQIDRTKKVKLIDLPKLTPRMTFIVNGEEFQISNQMRLRPGVYVKDKGTRVTAHFKLPIGKTKDNFFFEYHPENKKWAMVKSNSTVPLYSFLRSMDLTDNEIGQAVGQENLDKMRDDATPEKDVAKLYHLTYGEKTDPSRHRENQDRVADYFNRLPLDPDIMRLKYGKPHAAVSKEVLLETLKNIHGVVNRTQEPDIDATRFKEFRTFDDILAERLQVSTPSVQWRLKRRMREKDNVRDVIQPEKINRIALSFFNQSDLAHYPIQANPVDIISGMTKTTVFGEGAIGSKRAISRDERNLDASSIFIMDPVHTPENEDIGVVTHVTLASVKGKGNKIAVRLRDPKTGKLAEVPHDELYYKAVAFPGQHAPAASPMKPFKKTITVLHKGEVKDVPADQVDYVADSAARMFDFSSNLIPFLDATHAGRALMASKMIDQATALKHREPALVQSVAKENGKSFDEIVGITSSTRAPAEGEVAAVHKDRIEIKGADGKKHSVPIYDNFPLNDRNYIHSEATVQPGDKVRKGQVLADTIFTKGGTLAIGKNLRVAFIPYRGYNYEDGIVVSKSAADKLTSLHQYKFDLVPAAGGLHGKERYMAYFPNRLSSAQAAHLDDSGVVKQGTKLKRGDAIFLYMGPKEVTQEDVILGTISKKLVRPYSDQARFWDEDFEGTVTHVEKLPNGQVKVFVNTEEPVKVGDKLTNRFAAKGVVTAILPDEEMPHDAQKKPVEILINPHGLITRMNPGQIYEAIASKIAEKAGKPFQVQNFSGKNLRQAIEEAMKKHGVSDTEALFDPETGRKLGEILVGKQYIMKLMHSSKEKFNARNPDGAYTIDLRPAKTSEGGAQAIGAMETYAMLSHGALENLREMHTYKAEKNDEFWRAVTMKEPIPAPKPTFAFQKFLAYMKGAGIDTEKKGSQVRLKPLTDKEVGLLSAGSVQSGRLLLGKNLEPERGGLFDEQLTGGLSGKKWTHIDLPEPLPNPIFENALRSVLDLTKNQFDDLVHGKLFLDRAGKLSPDAAGKSGAEALRSMLKKVDVDREIARAREEIKGKKGSELNQVNRKLRFLLNLKSGGVEFDDLFMTKVPVIPPVFRPIYPMPSGSLQVSDLNYLYRDILVLKQKIEELKGSLPHEKLAPQRADLYDAVRALTGIGSPITRHDYRGILDIVVGDNPKSSYFGQKLMKKRQELTGRAAAVVDPHLSMDEVGLPEEMLWQVFKPFITQKLVERGITPLDAENLIKAKSPEAVVALDHALMERPVLMNRAPTLHKHSVIALKPKRVPGAAIRANPLIVQGLNLDFDGDTVAIHVPVTHPAVKEAWDLLPSKNPFSVSEKVLVTPRHEAQIGLFRMTTAKRKTGKSYPSEAEAMAALDRGEIQVDDEVKVAGALTTPGRIMVNRVLPPALRKPDLVLDKKTTERVITEIAKNNPKQLADVVDAMKELGNEFSYLSGVTVSLKDLTVLGDEKKRIFDKYDRQASQVLKANLPKDEREREIVRVYSQADKELTALTEDRLKSSGSTLHEMIVSGARGDIAQVKQIIAAPTLVEDITGRVHPHAIKSSFSEGMKPADYVVSVYGSRKGHIEKTVQTADPGALSKSMIATAINNRIDRDDCGTLRGRDFSIDDREAMGRFLSQDVPGLARRNDLYDDRLHQKFRQRVQKVVHLRTPLTCESPVGTCARCYGLNEKGQVSKRGDFVGVTASQAIAEPMTQLTLRMTHHGGVISPEAKAVGGFKALRTMLEMPEDVQEAALLSPSDTTVSSVEKVEGGWRIGLVGHGETLFTRQHPSVKIGERVARGQALTEGLFSPKDYLPLKGLEATRRKITDEIYGIFQGKVRKKHIETVVRSATDTALVTDASGREDVLEGDILPINILRAENSKVSKAVPVKKALGAWLLEEVAGVSPEKILTPEDIDKILKSKKRTVRVNPDPVKFEPVLRGINLVPQTRRDWIGQIAFRNLQDAVTRGVAEGWRTDINAYNPIPGLVYANDISLKNNESNLT